MRASLFLVLLAVMAAHALTGCSQFAWQQDGSANARAQFKKCAAENRITPEGQMLAGRLWMEDGTDTVTKLLDVNPLTPVERDALVQLHNRAMQCRQIMIANAVQHAAWQSQFFQDYTQRSDELFYKLANGQLPVGLANRLTIESDRKLMLDLANGQVQGIRPEEAKRQQATDSIIEAANRIIASQPNSALTATTCTWLGNTLYCAGPR